MCLCIAGSNQGDIGIYRILYFLSVAFFDRVVNALFSHFIRILRKNCVDFSDAHQLGNVNHAVKRYDMNVISAQLCDGALCADRHAVGCRAHNLNVVVLFQQGFHGLLCLVLAAAAVFYCGNRNMPVFQTILNAVFPQHMRFIAVRAAQYHGVCIVLFFDQLCGIRPLFIRRQILIGANVPVTVRKIRGSIDGQDKFAAFLCVFQLLCDALLIARRNNNHIRLELCHRSHQLRLFLDIALFFRRHDGNLHTELVRFVFRTRLDEGEIRIFR